MRESLLQLWLPVSDKNVFRYGTFGACNIIVLLSPVGNETVIGKHDVQFTNSSVSDVKKQ